MKKLLALLLIYTQLVPMTAWSSGRIQNEDVKTLTELTNAGGTVAQLINDSKIYVTANGINSQLSTAISSGLIGSGGSKNFILNGAIETSTTGYASFKDAAGVLPVDGTGGSPTHITLSRTTSSPLAGSGSLLVSNSGSSSAQGEGVSYDFTIDNGQQGKVQTISADYQQVSGTFQAGAVQGQDSDIEMYMYDVTNGVVIQPSNFKLYCASTTVTCTYTGTFQAAINSTSYRLIFFVPTTNTSAWAVKFDSISVGPSESSLGSGSAVAAVYTLSGGNVGSNGTTTVIPWDTKLIDTTGSMNSSSGVFTCPLTSNYYVSGSIETDTGTSEGLQRVFVRKNGSNFGNHFQSVNTDAQQVSTVFGILVPCNAGDTLDVTLHYTQGGTFTGTGSVSILMQPQPTGSGSGAIVAANYNSPTGTINNSQNLVTFSTKVSDTTNSYSGGTFTVPVSGNYDIAAGFVVSATFSVGNETDLYIKINGTNKYISKLSAGGASLLQQPTISVGAVPLLAGDTVQIYSYTDGTGASFFSGASSWFSIILNNSASSSLTSSVAISAVYNSSPSGGIGSSFQAITFATKISDTTGSMSGNTWTAPTSGLYNISGNIQINASYTGGDSVQGAFFLNGSTNISTDLTVAGSSSVTTIQAHPTIMGYPLKAGDTIQFEAKTSASSPSYGSNAQQNYFSIVKAN